MQSLQRRIDNYFRFELTECFGHKSVVWTIWIRANTCLYCGKIGITNGSIIGGNVNELTLESLARRLERLEHQVSRLMPVDMDPPGTCGDEQADDPEAINRWLATFDAIPPATMTIEEETAWQDARTDQKQIDAAAISRLVDDLSEMK